MHPIIILGAGHAAYSLAREIRRHQQEQAITLVTRDSGDSYYKPNLSKALAMGKTPQQLVLKTRQQQEVALDITVRANTTATAIDPSSQTIELDNGDCLPYDKLVFATGADSRRFEIPGNGNGEVLHVNDLDEYTQFIEQAQQAQHILIMGAGLVGCEFANDLHSQGIRSTLVDPAPYPLATLLPAPLADALTQGLSNIGVAQHYHCHVAKLDKTGRQFKATLSNGETLEAALVLSAAGLAVDSELARQTGIACNRGIVVNDQLATNQTNIYALGDCAEINGQLRPFIAPILPSVKALAQTLLGNPTEVVFGAMPVTVKTPCCPVVACPPDNVDDGIWEVEGDAPNLIARHKTGEAINGFACIGSRIGEAKALAAELQEHP